MDHVVAVWCSVVGDGVVRGRRHPRLTDRKYTYRVLSDVVVQQRRLVNYRLTVERTYCDVVVARRLPRDLGGRRLTVSPYQRRAQLGPNGAS